MFLHPETKERFKKLGKNNSNIYSGQHILSPKNGEKKLLDKNDLPLFPAQKIVKLSNNDFVDYNNYENKNYDKCIDKYW